MPRGSTDLTFADENEAQSLLSRVRADADDLSWFDFISYVYHQFYFTYSLLGLLLSMLLILITFLMSKEVALVV